MLNQAVPLDPPTGQEPPIPKFPRNLQVRPTLVGLGHSPHTPIRGEPVDFGRWLLPLMDGPTVPVSFTLSDPTGGIHLELPHQIARCGRPLVTPPAKQYKT